MAIIESILLSYSNKNRLEYQKYAEFFRMLGIYVCEDLKDDEELTLLIREKDYSLRYDIDHSVNEGIILKSFFPLHFFFGDDIIIKKIWQIFQTRELLQASVTLQYFYMKASEVSKAGEQFKCAADELKHYIKENETECENNQYIRYAKLYCRQKANLARYVCGEKIAYSIEKLADEGFLILSKFPQFSNVWMLIGLIFEIEPRYTRNTIDAFQNAIQNIPGEPYASSIYYRLGKKCETVQELKNLENQAYQNAYQLMPKYRNIYKVARKYMDLEKWEEAKRYFRECLNKLALKKDYMDPLEQEYYYKIKSHLSYICIMEREYEEAIEYAMQALDFKDEIYDGASNAENVYARIYFQIYEENANSIISLELRRMGSRQLYRYLAIAYQNLGNERIADQYWDIVNMKW